MSLRCCLFHHTVRRFSCASHLRKSPAFPLPIGTSSGGSSKVPLNAEIILPQICDPVLKKVVLDPNSWDQTAYHTLESIGDGAIYLIVLELVHEMYPEHEKYPGLLNQLRSQLTSNEKLSEWFELLQMQNRLLNLPSNTVLSGGRKADFMESYFGALLKDPSHGYDSVVILMKSLVNLEKTFIKAFFNNNITDKMKCFPGIPLGDVLKRRERQQYESINITSQRKRVSPMNDNFFRVDTSVLETMAHPDTIAVPIPDTEISESVMESISRKKEESISEESTAEDMKFADLWYETGTNPEAVVDWLFGKQLARFEYKHSPSTKLWSTTIKIGDVTIAESRNDVNMARSRRNSVRRIFLIEPSILKMALKNSSRISARAVDRAVRSIKRARQSEHFKNFIWLHTAPLTVIYEEHQTTDERWIFTLAREPTTALANLFYPLVTVLKVDSSNGSPDVYFTVEGTELMKVQAKSIISGKMECCLKVFHLDRKDLDRLIGVKGYFKVDSKYLDAVFAKMKHVQTLLANTE